MSSAPVKALASLGLLSLILTVSLSSASAQKLSLNELFQRTTDSAVENDYAVKRAREDLKIERAEILRRRGRFLPDASYSASVDEGDDFIGHSIDLSWNLFDGMSDSYRLKIAKTELKIKELDLQITEREVRTRSGKRLLDLIDLAMQEEIQQQEVELRKTSLEAMRQRFEQGLVSESEVLKMNVDLINSEISLAQVRERVERERLEFLRVIGYSISIDLLPEIPLPQEQSRPRLTSLKEEFLKLSPEKIRREQEVYLQDFQARRASWQVYSPSLDASYSYNNNSGFGYNGDPYEFDSQLGLSLTLPFFSQLEDYGERRIQRIRQIQAKFNLQDTVRRRSTDLEQLIVSLKTLSQTIQLQAENEKFATQFYSQSINRFRLGLTNTNDMSLDQRRLTDTRLTLSRLKRNYHKTVLDIYELVGKKITLN